MKNVKWALSIFVVLAVLFGGVSYLQKKNRDSKVKLAGTEIPNPYEIGDFNLNSAQTPTQTFDRSNFLGKYTVLYFGFTHCPDACPITLAQFKAEIPQLNEEARKKVQFVMVSVDPERDTAEALKKYVQSFHPEILSAVGPDSELQKLVGYAKTTFSKEPENAGDPNLYMMAHSPRYFLINPEAQLMAVYNPPIASGVLANDLNTLVAKPKALF